MLEQDINLHIDIKGKDLEEIKKIEKLGVK